MTLYETIYGIAVLAALVLMVWFYFKHEER